jgi:predicted DNA-binding transcriptional regulator YafY
VSDQSALVRQWLLIKRLGVRHGGLTIGELAGELEVSQKTVRRDLATLNTVGFPVEETVGDYGRKSYRLDPRCARPDLAFTFDEALALYLGRKYLEPLAGTLIWEAAERSFAKIRASLGDRVLRYLDRVGDAFVDTAFGVTDYSKHAEILDRLLVGIEDHRVVWITYQSQRATEPVTYDVHPYRLTRHLGSLYLIGLKMHEAELRTWRVDRIEAAEVDAVTFTVPEDLDLDAHFAGSFGIYDGKSRLVVRVRIAPSMARYVREKLWHPSQQMQPHRDGSLTIEFRLSGTEEIKSWILSFGRDAEVLEPKSLRQDVAAELQATLEKYRDGSGPHTRKKTRPSSRLASPSQ